MCSRRLHRQILPVLAVLLLVLTASLRAQAPASQPGKTQRFFWKASSATAEVYLLGSIHVATDDMYPLPAEIEAAYKDAKNLVVEADVTKVNELALALQVMQKGMYAQGDSLAQHVSGDTMKALRTYAAANDLGVETLLSMKPVMAAMTVESLFLMKQGLDTDKGIDLHFLKQANAGKDKNIVELESGDFQINLLFSIDDKLAEKWLLESLKESSKEDLDKMVKGWKEGDDQGLTTSMADDDKKDPDGAKLSDLLIYQRNTGMTTKIADLLKGNDKSFVVVGAAHLIGDKGIIKQLEAKGYKIERPTLTAPPKAAPATITPAR
jgi:uncharacterized protein